MSRDAQKKLAAEKALEFVEEGSVVGVGTGSTVAFFIDGLARMKSRLEGAVSSSEQSSRLLIGHGIPVLDLNAVGPLKLYVDDTALLDEFQRLLGGEFLLRVAGHRRAPVRLRRKGCAGTPPATPAAPTVDCPAAAARTRRTIPRRRAGARA